MLQTNLSLSMASVFALWNADLANPVFAVGTPHVGRSQLTRDITTN